MDDSGEILSHLGDKFPTRIGKLLQRAVPDPFGEIEHGIANGAASKGAVVRKAEHDEHFQEFGDELQLLIDGIFIIPVLYRGKHDDVLIRERMVVVVEHGRVFCVEYRFRPLDFQVESRIESELLVDEAEIVVASRESDIAFPILSYPLVKSGPYSFVVLVHRTLLPLAQGFRVFSPEPLLKKFLVFPFLDGNELYYSFLP